MAMPIFRQNLSGNATTTETITTLTPIPGNLLICTVGVVNNSAITTPTGYSVAVNEVQGTTAQGTIFYRVADGSEGTSLAVTATGDVRVVFLEVDNMAVISPLDQNNKVGSTTVTTLASAAITPTVTSSLSIIMYAITSASNTWSSWTNGYATANNANANRNMTGYKIITAGAGVSTSTTGTWTATGVTASATANFKVLTAPTAINNFQSLSGEDNGNGVMSFGERIR